MSSIGEVNLIMRDLDSDTLALFFTTGSIRFVDSVSNQLVKEFFSQYPTSAYAQVGNKMISVSYQEQNNRSEIIDWTLVKGAPVLQRRIYLDQRKITSVVLN